eukprot:Hpha_TRINITY_DN6768_c0_g1::TRINITY_DN6768_c0_g1_i1::g.110936::m.110936
MSAVIVVDWQVDFCDPKGMLGHESDPCRPMLAATAKFVDAARAAGATIVWVQAAYERKKTLPIGMEKAFVAFGGEELASACCRPDLPGYELEASMKPHADDIRAKKHTYSAFFKTDLADRLREKGIKKLYFVGTMTSVCVAASAQHAVFENFEVEIASDATFDPSAQEAALGHFKTFYGGVRTTEEMLADIKA